MRLLFAVAVAYAVFQLSRGVYVAVTAHPADVIVLRDMFWSILEGSPAPSPYPPHTSILLAPILLLPPQLTEGTMFILNLFLICFVWWRISFRVGLTPLGRSWFLVLFLCMVSVRVTLAHGQLGILVLAGAVWAFTSPTRQWLGFVFAAVKLSIAFPILLYQLLKKPRVLFPTIALGIVGIVGLLLWTGMPIPEYVSYVADGLSRDTTGFGVDVGSVLERSVGTTGIVQFVVGAVWVVAFTLVVTRISRPIELMTALLALSLLPLYHRAYDLVVLAPALAIFLKSLPMVYPLLMTAGLAGADLALANRDFFGMKWMEPISIWYLPSLILAVIAILLWIEPSNDPISEKPTPPAEFA